MMTDPRSVNCKIWSNEHGYCLASLRCINVCPMWTSVDASTEQKPEQVEPEEVLLGFVKRVGIDGKHHWYHLNGPRIDSVYHELFDRIRTLEADNALMESVVEVAKKTQYNHLRRTDKGGFVVGCRCNLCDAVKALNTAQEQKKDRDDL